MKPEDPPIIIACQTNHALDQLLRHTAKIDSKCFVRLGARSQDKEIVRPRTLYNLRPEYPTPKSAARISATRALKQQTNLIKKTLEPFSQGMPMIGLGFMRDHHILTDAQCASIEVNANAWSTAGEVSDDADPFSKYFSASVASIQPKSMPVFETYEAAELDVEELKETEAENAAPDDDEWDVLSGDFLPLEDALAGSTRMGQKKLIVKSKKLYGARRTFDNAEQLLAIVDDLAMVEISSRGLLFDFLMHKAKRVVLTTLSENFKAYHQASRLRQIGRWEEDAFILNQHKVVGMTTTGFSKNRALIAGIQPRIVLLEEAAEILEAPVIATCVESLQHLIMVGDHQQLRPHIRVQELEGVPYNLNVSLFERLVNNKVTFSTLQMQRRMIPAIRNLLRPIYGNLISDHVSVQDIRNRPMVPGMGSKSIWFYHHEFRDSRDYQMSCKNDFEASMVVGFAAYLSLNGVSLEQITILTFYNGQKREIKRLVSKNQYLRDSRHQLKVVTVDSYQGEENSVVLLSLVRSNDNNKIGFLENINRICVAISRAQSGLYIFGNRKLLCAESKTWKEICDILEGEGTGLSVIGLKIPLVDQRHQRETSISRETLSRDRASSTADATNRPGKLGQALWRMQHAMRDTLDLWSWQMHPQMSPVR